jgi:DNA polymerase-3 subunit beta
MKAVVARNDLVTALERCGRAVGKSVVQVLGGLHLEVTDKLVVTATDMERVIQHDVPADKSSKPGVVAVGPARRLIAAIKTLPEGVHVMLQKKKDHLSITSGRTAMTFELYQEADYPAIDVTGRPLATVASDQFAKAFGYVSNCYSTDLSRPVLCGVKIELADGKMDMAATDSFRLGAVTVDALCEVGAEVVVPGVGLEEAMRAAKTSGEIAILESEKYVWFDAGPMRVAARKIEGQFPSWRQLRGDQFQPGAKPPASVTLDGAQALESIDRIHKLADNSVGLPVRVLISPLADKVTFTLGMRDIGKITESVSAEIESDEEMEIGLNPKLFHETLDSNKGDRIHLGLISPLRPVFITNDEESDPDRWMILMPVRLL